MDDSEENVLGTPLAPCSMSPETGYLRDGHCRQLDRDPGRHEVCAVMTQAFLEYSREQGNDLITPRPEWQFPGLHPGDRWCVCLPRWVEALDAGVAPPVLLEATTAGVTDEVSVETLRKHAYEEDEDKSEAEGGSD
ncbi:DUF2237 family protein [Natronocalculus amylovorans]|uniref:DUF2237 domain-containing protein n=1 Tax=Natronocalculus amylovorans TaxID=2917812 RepID=A0AAE3FUT6_9EURY|nr:DUF2237 domain-containing protein [Natronocalculus amylovorans]MCL9815571.1 DUF2237 domain-containing protein [Natronocalculus amylovorans]